MCGIGLHAVLMDNSSALCDDTKLRTELIRTCLARCIEPRGPDLPQSHIHRPSDTQSDWDMFMCASVLHMRGPTLTPQPLTCTHRGRQFSFLWNGECYQTSTAGSGIAYDTAASPSSSPETAYPTPTHQVSDTQFVLHNILQSAFSTTQDTLLSIANVMSCIHGEYAFVLWVHPSPQDRLDQGCIYYGRDPLGRRSLLLAMAQLNEKTDEEVFNHTVQPCMISSLILSSVALTDFFLQEQQAYHTSYENSDNISITQLEAVQEVIPGRVYQFNLSTKKISHVDILHIPTQHLAHERDASVCSIVDRNIVPEAMNQRDLLKDNPFDHVPSFTNVSDTCEIEQERMPRIPHTLGSLSLSFSTIHIQAAETLLQHLSTAVRRRVINLSSLVSTPSSRVAVLFSGGLDSVILAALSHFHIPIEETIDLINVSFVSTLTDENVETHSSHSVLGHNKIRKDQHNFARDTEEIHQKTDGHDPFESPDRIAAIQSFHELSQLWPQRTYRLLLVNIHYSEVLDYQTRIRALIHPQTSTMDFNIGTAMWFASRGRGVDYNDYKGNESNIHQTQSHITISKAPIVLVGIGADEQMAGYGRHRSVYKRGGYDALRAELSMEKDRLWTRNLGRDDRIIADHGKEARFPYLDEDVVAYLNSLDVADRCDMTKPPGIGDKVILRIAANMLGLRHCTSLVKRAIQFGSRIAHVSDVQKFGSRQRAKGWKPYV